MILDLFAGPGGWSEGLRMLGLADVGIEWDAAACATRAAAGHETVHADVAEVSPRSFVRVDGLIASPPCQSFSSAGAKRGHDDDRGALVWEPLRFIAHLRPRWVVLEEVRAVADVWRAYLEPLRMMGYDASVRLVDAADFGVPQNRVRALLMARSDAPVVWPQPTHGDGLLTPEPLVTMSEALELGWGWEYDSGQNSTLGGGAKARYVRSCGRPAGTVTGQTTSQWVLRRGDERRKLTLADSARLQSFPDGYPFQGSPEERSQQIGDAVPPLLAAHLLAALVDRQLSKAAA